jgi:hypothetical protein
MLSGRTTGSHVMSDYLFMGQRFAVMKLQIAYVTYEDDGKQEQYHTPLSLVLKVIVINRL